MLATFVTFALSHLNTDNPTYELTPDKVFVSLALFNVLRLPLFLLPLLITMIIEVRPHPRNYFSLSSLTLFLLLLLLPPFHSFPLYSPFAILAPSPCCGHKKGGGGGGDFPPFPPTPCINHCMPELNLPETAKILGETAASGIVRKGG